MSKKFEQQLAELGITLTQTQFNQFDKYYEMLVEWNKVMNLTCLLYTSPSPRDISGSRMPSSA